MGEYDFEVANALLLVIGLIGGLIEGLVLPAFGSLIGLADAMPILTLLAASLPLSLLTTVPIARLERNLEFGHIALIEVASQIIYYLVAIPLALNGWRAWSLAIAFTLQVAFLCIQFHITSTCLPHVSWNRGIIKNILRYALAYSAATWVWQARVLVNPLIVGSVLGLEAVGFASLSIKIVEVLSFVRSATLRISLAALGHLRNDKSKVITAVTEGMELQVLSSGLVYILFSLIGGKLIVSFFGLPWLAAFDLFPFIAVGYLTNCVFSLQSSALSVYGKNAEVTLFSIVHVLIFSSSAYVFTNLFGLIGYGYAELAAITSYVVIAWCFRRQVGSLSYFAVVRWYAFIVTALLLRPISIWFLIILCLAMIAWPANVRRICHYKKTMRALYK